MCRDGAANMTLDIAIYVSMIVIFGLWVALMRWTLDDPEYRNRKKKRKLYDKDNVKYTDGDNT